MSFKCCLFLQFLIPIFVLVIWLGIFFFTKLEFVCMQVCLYVSFFFVSSIVQKLSSFDFDTKTKIVHTLSCLITIFELVRQWWASFNTLLYCQVLEGLLGFLQASNISNHFFVKALFCYIFFSLKMCTETCLFYHFVSWTLQAGLK